MGLTRKAMGMEARLHLLLRAAVSGLAVPPDDDMAVGEKQIVALAAGGKK